MKRLGFLYYDLVLIFEVYFGNGQTFPVSTVHFTVDYKELNTTLSKEIEKLQQTFDYYGPGSKLNSYKIPREFF